MHFKVTARTILQLGSELISSDAIAFYELIKNAFDAGSPKVEVRVFVHLPQDTLNQAIAQLSKLIEGDIRNLTGFDANMMKESLLSHLQYNTHESAQIAESIRNARSPQRLLKILVEANYIEFRDQGEGMSLVDLEDIYLTIGTRSRQSQRKKSSVTNSGGFKRPILGEKGLGRLSVMRLGDGLRVTTSREGETHFNILEIDWDVFSHDSNALLDSITIKPVVGDLKPDPAHSGTSIKIFKLQEPWTREKLHTIAREELSRFVDPFSRQHRSFMSIFFNDAAVIIPSIEKLLFENYHAYVKVDFSVEPNQIPRLTGYIDYRLLGKEKSFVLEGSHLNSAIGTSENTLVALGSFSASFYWYNGGVLQAIDGIGTIADVRKLIRTWAGGLMVFRDGFRVNPYGGPDDDWLRLDPRALGVSGYKVNRKQIIGKVDISSVTNPTLLDQTNREGLRNSPEKETLIALLQYVMWAEFKVFLDKVDNDRLTNDPLDLGELETRLELSEKKLSDNLQLLIRKYPEIKEESSTIQAIREAFGRSRRLFSDARAVFQSYEQRRDETLHLAALGLMVDILAHELNRSTHHALETLNTFDKNDLPERANSLLNNLRLQLKTLQTRLKVLDPLGPTGRNHKERFDLKRLVEESLAAHEAQFLRHNIKWSIRTDFEGSWYIKAVQGMFVQILENCLANSVYWLGIEKILHTNFQPTITVHLEKETGSLYFTDNGPGISFDKREEVFWPFFTTKPPGDGKGLGLYISREIARYHGTTLALSSRFAAHSNRLNTFQLDIAPLLKSK